VKDTCANAHVATYTVVATSAHPLQRHARVSCAL
jgi:hypothetical protein